MGQAINRIQQQGSHPINHIQVSQAEIYEGHLVLINGDNPIKRPIKEDKLLPISSNEDINELHDGMSMEKTGLQQLSALLAASEALEEVVVVSAYRTKEEQEHIYATSLVENGPVYTASYVALPDQSEHQTGLAVDVGKISRDVDFIAPSFPSNGACQTFKQLAADYGFIQRYKEGKESITKISCEPWHFRYVGYPHSRLIEEYSFCLEEYIDFVKGYTYSGDHLRFKNGSLQVEIYYVPAEVGPSTTVPIVKCDLYRLSGNNRDGFIITAFHGSEHNG
ncbi:D-alanyl-D-alanine carboxypeptidase family protein [Paenibacillus sp. PL91]|uniref:D-alanyl-D-alanine carboxypeptidase family protein n=1 Tax=Paenibacillus sp. PL91 TaxID=2729538 RepID=UPI00145F985E|nr:D-alanyl-D-alanine carboxypeptidase family protein [Paenibacillus sp. PL91]MBC9199046.1 D-alanyl-D-alanine carboxypeptidase family protein [Paenibacillus sp. PL91]